MFQKSSAQTNKMNETKNELTYNRCVDDVPYELSDKEKIQILRDQVDKLQRDMLELKGHTNFYPPIFDDTPKPEIKDTDIVCDTTKEAQGEYDADPNYSGSYAVPQKNPPWPF